MEPEKVIRIVSLFLLIAAFAIHVATRLMFPEAPNHTLSIIVLCMLPQEMPSRTEAHDAGPGTTGNSPTAPGTDAVRRRRPEEDRTGSRRPKKTARRPPTRKGFVRMRVEGGPVGESEGRWGPQVPEAGKTRERAGEYPEGHTKGIRKEPKGNPGGTGVTQEKSLYKTGKGAAPGE